MPDENCDRCFRGNQLIRTATGNRRPRWSMSGNDPGFRADGYCVYHIPRRQIAMRRIFLSTLFIVALLAGGWALYHKDQISSPRAAWRLAHQQIDWLTSGNTRLASFSRSGRPFIRIASFNIQVFGEKKASQPEIMMTLGKIVREFDLVAIQEIRSQDERLLVRFVSQLNETGRRFCFVISPRLGSSSYKEQYAFIFDTQTVQLDGSHSYTIYDPDDLLRREPHVGWFRTNHADARQAFTFSLVNLHLDSRTPDREIQHLNQIFRAIRNDGRGEDDVIIVGDFNLPGAEIGPRAERSGLTWLINNQPTNVRNTRQYDNIIIDRLATTEFTGRSGVFDFLREYNLSMDQALRVSDHLPVWAEFALTEGDAHSLAHCNLEAETVSGQRVGRRSKLPVTTR